MRTTTWLRWTILGALAVGTLAAGTLVVSSRWLYRGYRPSAPDVDAAFLPGAASTTLDWLQREQAAAIVVLVIAALVVVGSAAMVVQARRRTAWVLALLGSLAALAGAGVSLATHAAVQWDQLALWAVTVGPDVAGYQAATDTPMVRFVVVDGREVAPADYRLDLAVHMGGAALAVVGLLVALVVVAAWGGDQPVWRRTKDPISSTASTASGNAG